MAGAGRRADAGDEDVRVRVGVGEWLGRADPLPELVLECVGVVNSPDRVMFSRNWPRA